MNNFPKANSFDINLVRSKIMGPNPLKLCEELLCDADVAKGSRVCDLGSGTGVRFGLSADSAFRWSVDSGGELPSLTFDALGGARDRAASSPMYRIDDLLRRNCVRLHESSSTVE